MIKAVILDRDGTINVNHQYVHKVEDFEFLPGAIEGMKRLYDNDFKLFVATNQSGIALNLYNIADMRTVHDYMLNELKNRGVDIEQIYFCEHHSSVSKCGCRKPASGMLEKAIKDHNIDPSLSYMVGDRMTDVEAGQGAGFKTILVGHPYAALFGDVNYHCQDLQDVADIVLGVKS